jgi:hypothetical protein
LDSLLGSGHSKNAERAGTMDRRDETEAVIQRVTRMGIGNLSSGDQNREKAVLPRYLDYPQASHLPLEILDSDIFNKTTKN